MSKKYGIVLEGGGLRGIFTAGVLDYFMVRNLKFPYVCGVSMGACAAMSMISGQLGRTKRSVLHDGNEPYYGPENLLRTGKLLDIDIIFDEYPFKQYPFDFGAYFASDVQSEYAVTSLDSGEAVFLSEKQDQKRMLDIVKASSSLPLISKPVTVDGRQYMDGGIADPVPVKRAFQNGCKKCVVVLTKPLGYKPSTGRQTLNATGIVYRRHPEFVKKCIERDGRYISRMRLLSLLEEAGMAYVIRPSVPVIDRFETNETKLLEYYANGYETAERVYEEMTRFLGEENILFND